MVEGPGGHEIWWKLAFSETSGLHQKCGSEVHPSPKDHRQQAMYEGTVKPLSPDDGMAMA